MRVYSWTKWGSSLQNESQKKYSQSVLRLVNWIITTSKFACLAHSSLRSMDFAWLESQDLQDSVSYLTLGLACGCFLPGRFSGYLHRTLSVPPELFVTHQVCDQVVSSCDDAS